MHTCLHVRGVHSFEKNAKVFLYKIQHVAIIKYAYATYLCCLPHNVGVNVDYSPTCACLRHVAWCGHCLTATMPGVYESDSMYVCTCTCVFVFGCSCVALFYAFAKVGYVAVVVNERVKLYSCIATSIRYHFSRDFTNNG